MNAFLSGALAAVLVASPVPSNAVAEDPFLLVVAFGDSTTATRNGVDEVYAQRISGWLAPDFPVDADWPTTVVVNRGVAGDTTDDARERLATGVLDLRPDVVVIQFGLNDQAVDAPGGTSRVPIERYEANLRAIVRAVAERGAVPVLMTPNPLVWTPKLREVYGHVPYDPGSRWGLDGLNRRYAEVCRRVATEEEARLVDVHASFLEHDAGDGTADELLLDGMHPNDQGHALVARVLEREVVGLFRAGEARPRTPEEPELSDWEAVLVEGGRAVGVHDRFAAWSSEDGWLVNDGDRPLTSARSIEAGDFRLVARLRLDDVNHTAASFELPGGHFGFDGKGERLYTEGTLFGGGVRLGVLNDAYFADGKPFDFEVVRTGGRMRFLLDGRTVQVASHGGPIDVFGFRPLRARLGIERLSIHGDTRALPDAPHAGYRIPVVDLAGETERQVVVDREPGQYLGHPTTVLLEDRRTMIAVYPKGHGRGAIVMKRSTDGGLTWSERLPTPENWATSQEVPTIHRVVDRDGVKRLTLFSGLFPIRMAVSEDDGLTWSPLEPIGDYGGIVAMGCVERIGDGRYMALFHDDGRFLRGAGKRSGFDVFKVVSEDGGLTWGQPVVIATHARAHLCEPGLVRSPDGKTIAVLLRENSRRMNSFVIFSEDEGQTWSEPRELPGSLTGDRHTGVYTPDGRIFLSFRDTTLLSETRGDWVGWVGTWEDIEEGREGQYRVRLMDNTKSADCAYPGVVLLPDGTIVTTTYGHWTEGESPYVVSVRFRMAEIDERAAGGR